MAAKSYCILFLLYLNIILHIIKHPGPHEAVRGVKKRYTTLIRLRIAPPPSAAPPARSILCNGRTRPALRRQRVQAGNSGASTARHPHRLAPAADSLWAGRPLPFLLHSLLQDQNYSKFFSGICQVFCFCKVLVKTAQKAGKFVGKFGTFFHCFSRFFSAQ